VLDRGFRVRAATRSVKKQQPFQQYLEGKYGKDAIEFVEVTDFTDPKVWDALLEGKPGIPTEHVHTCTVCLLCRFVFLFADRHKGVQGVIHLATDTSFSPRYDEVVPGIEALTETFLAAVARAPHVKSVVMTSSRIAVFNPTVGQDLDLTVNDWADYMVDLAKTVKEDDPIAPVLVCTCIHLEEAYLDCS
jgi:nucleoside-diphosphate-sugar epimerase